MSLPAPGADVPVVCTRSGLVLVLEAAVLPKDDREAIVHRLDVDGIKARFMGRRCPGCSSVLVAGGAAPYCDYRPLVVASRKIRKTGGPLKLKLEETPDVVARLAEIKDGQWMVAFALETEDPRMRALQKLEQKSCDLIVLNGPEAIHVADTNVEIIDPRGRLLGEFAGSTEP